MADANRNRQKWALLIGINKYPKLRARYQLSGCVNDVELMADVLQRKFGFHNITVLRDAEATNAGILAAMNTLAESIGKNDIVVIHYSGHGSQRTARYPQYESDGLDETIVPYDSGRAPYPNHDITDNEIYAWLLRIRDTTPYVTLIFDCCHSGSIVRDAFGTATRYVEPDARALETLQLPAPKVNADTAKAAIKDIASSGWLPLSQYYVLIAGCQDDESSYEYCVDQEGELILHGALTYFLCQELNKVETVTTYRDVFERTSAQVSAIHRRQHPQMEGARDRALFGVQKIVPFRFVPVHRRRGNQVILAAGAAHGMTTGSLWTLYPQGTKEITEQTPKLGRVRVNKVRAVTSDAEIVEEEGLSAIAQNSRAMEYAHFYGEMRLVVKVQDANSYPHAIAELSALIESSRLLREAETDELAHAHVYVVGPRPKVSMDSPVPQLGSLTEATWAVVGRDGRLMMPTHAVADTEAVYTVRDNLEKAARYRQGLALENANRAGRLNGNVQMTLLRAAPDGTWVEAEPEDQSGQIVYEEGERIAFKIVNHHNAPVYVSVLDFGLTGAIDLLHPIEGASERLISGGSIEVGIREGDEVVLYLPDNFDQGLDPEDNGPTGGTETFKLFATTHEADFSYLMQEGYRNITTRSAKGSDSPLGQLLDMALTGHGIRDARRNRVPPDEEWTTVERTLILRAKTL